MAWQRRRRHSFGPFYVDTNRFRPTSWGIHEGPVTFNETRRRGSIRLPLGMGSWTFGRGTSRRHSGHHSGCATYVFLVFLIALVAAALIVGLYVVPAVTTWLHSVGILLG